MPQEKPAKPKPTKAKKPRDLAILGGPTEDGSGQQLLRLREGELSYGEIRPLREGQPITSELVQLHPLDASKRVCAVEVLHAPDEPSASEPRADEARADEPGAKLSRPARVTNPRYRKNWSAIFDDKRKRTLN